MVAIIDIASTGLGMEIKHRCERFRPIRCFIGKSLRVNRIVIDCMKSFKAIRSDSDFGDVIEYSSYEDIVKAVKEWI